MNYLSMLVGLIFSLTSAISLASDGLNDLKNKLKQLQAKTPIIAELRASFVDQHDDDIKQGEVKVLLKDNSTGFSLTYKTEQLTMMATEKAQKAQNEDSPSPTLDAAAKLKAVDLHRVLSASEDFLQFINRGEFIGESITQLDGRNVRLLTFALPMEVLIHNKRTRKYVDDFEARYQVWLDNDGTPLKSHLDFQGSGSAYLILNVEAYGQNTEFYQVINQRLVVSSSQSRHGSKSFFGDFERNIQKQVTVIN